MTYARTPRTVRPPRSVRPVKDGEVIGTDEPVNPRKIVEAYERRGITIRLTDDGKHIDAAPAALLTCGDLARLATFKSNITMFLLGSRRRI